jgi:hypothetical protein
MDTETKNRIQETIRNAELKLTELETDLRDGRLAGINLAESEQQARDLRSKITQLKSVYGV